VVGSKRDAWGGGSVEVSHELAGETVMGGGSDLVGERTTRKRLGRGPGLTNGRRVGGRWVLGFLSHRIICKRADANCSLHPRVFQGIESIGKQ
jgi:hypothetical protein